MDHESKFCLKLRKSCGIMFRVIASLVGLVCALVTQSFSLYVVGSQKDPSLGEVKDFDSK